MGSIWFDPGILADSASETVGYKAGLALSLEAMCDLLTGTRYADLLMASEEDIIRIRSEAYGKIIYRLLYKVGYTEEEYDDDYLGIKIFHKYRGTVNEGVYLRVLEIFAECFPTFLEVDESAGTKVIDPSPFLDVCRNELGEVGHGIAIEKLEAMDRGMKLSPYTRVRYTEWRDVEQLETLFSGGGNEPEQGKFIDQRFVNYLFRNPEAVHSMHWRKFEELAAEFFERTGYRVELGTGRNDDGVDIRVWKETQNKDSEWPDCIIQCKRQRDKIGKIVVKGLYTDVQFYGARRGLLVTTSELSRGARQTVRLRGYPVEEVNGTQLYQWLRELHIPGSGIVRV